MRLRCTIGPSSNFPAQPETWTRSVVPHNVPLWFLFTALKVHPQGLLVGGMTSGLWPVSCPSVPSRPLNLRTAPLSRSSDDLPSQSGGQRSGCLVALVHADHFIAGGLRSPGAAPTRRASVNKRSCSHTPQPAMSPHQPDQSTSEVRLPPTPHGSVTPHPGLTGPNKSPAFLCTRR